MAVYNVDKSHNGGNLTCKKGDQIILTLPENPTTGFKWHIIGLEGIKLINDQFDLNNRPEKELLGAGGTRKFKFEFVGPQKASLYLMYFQEWEGKESSSDSFRLSVG